MNRSVFGTTLHLDAVGDFAQRLFYFGAPRVVPLGVELTF